MTMVRCATPGCETLVAVEQVGRVCVSCQRSERRPTQPKTLDGRTMSGRRSFTSRASQRQAH
jgi:hypothetical protein